MRMNKVTKMAGVLCTAVVLATVAAPTAKADVLGNVDFRTGNVAQSGDDNLLYNGLNDVTSGNPVKGHFNNGGFDFFALVESNVVGQSLQTGGGGQAFVENSTAANGLTDMDIYLSDVTATFKTIIFKLSVPNKKADKPNLTITADLVNGADQSFSYTPSTMDNSGFFTLIALNGDAFKNINIKAMTNKFLDVRQVRIGGASVPPPIKTPVPSAVPLPAASWMGLALLAGMAALSFRNKQRTVKA